jgi:formate hydrogenlyase transcriptional activator
MAAPAVQQVAPDRYAALLELSKIIASHRDLEELFRDLAPLLHSVIRFDYLSVLLHDPARDVMRIHTLEGWGPGTVHAGMEFSMEESPSAWVWRTQEPLLVPDVTRETRFPQAMKRVKEHGMHSFFGLPLTTPRRRLGTFNLGRHEPDAYTPEDVEFARHVAGQVAVALENALNYQQARELQEQVVHERDRLKLLLAVNNAVVSSLSLAELFREIPASVRAAMQCDAACLSLPDPEKNTLRIHGLDLPDGRGYMQEEMVLPIDGSSPGEAFRTGRAVVFGSPPDSLHATAMNINSREGFQSGCFLPVIREGRRLGVLHLLDRRPNAFSEQDAGFLLQVASQVAIALDNALQYREINLSRSRLAEERSYLRSEIRTDHGFDEILGETPDLRQVLRQVETVAPTDSTVLVLGETGTGKELVARAIHGLSGRREHLFAKLNCAAIPSGLLESELFGHEKGAFTGAVTQKVGRFELADKGTLFLDEIGDIPLELQPKLLRVLQEQEFERLGGTRSMKVDVRLVAATNQDLGRMVEERRFRADLYYRLNVFPIRIPPLRQRHQDIPILARHFVEKYARRINKHITEIPAEVMEALLRYDWPGNIRELQNFIERAVILSPGSVLTPPLAELRHPAAAPRRAAAATLEDAERQHILEALQATEWTLGGSEGAAARLGIPRTTLIYKMRRLGIHRPGN